MSVRLDRLRRMRAWIDGEIEEETARLATIQRRLIPELASAADLYGVTADEIMGSGRTRQVVRARWAAAWLLRQKGNSYGEISRTLGYSDHTVARHAVRQVDATPATRALLLGLEVVA